MFGLCFITKIYYYENQVPPLLKYIRQLGRYKGNCEREVTALKGP